jgi:hypothetical protein
MRHRISAVTQAGPERAITNYQKEEMSVADLCREYGISLPTGYRWKSVGPETRKYAEYVLVFTTLPTSVASTEKSWRPIDCDGKSN